MKAILITVILLLVCSCRTTIEREYFPPTDTCSTIVELEDGTKTFRGALKYERIDDGFSIGTQGFGTYHITIIDLSAF